MKIIKNIINVILILIFFLSIPNMVKADNFDLNAFDNGDTLTGVKEATGVVNGFAEQAISAVKVGSVAIATLILLVIATKYMISSPGDRADIKKYAINYVIGATVLFGVTGILTIIENVASTIKK